MLTTRFRKALPALLALPAAGSGFALALTYRSVDVTLKKEVGVLTVAQQTGASPVLGARNPAVRGGVAYVAASHGVGRWNVGLSPQLPLTLNVSQQTGSTWLDLRGLPVSRLKLVRETGTTQIQFPAGDLSATLEQQTGDVELYVPAGTALQLTVHRLGTGSVTVEGREVAAGQNLSGTYQTANFAGAARRITVKLTQDTGEIQIFGAGKAIPDAPR